MNPTNNKESLNIRIRGNSYEYTWDSVGFGQNRQGTVTNNNLLEILQESYKISHKLVQSMLNACTRDYS